MQISDHSLLLRRLLSGLTLIGWLSHLADAQSNNPPLDSMGTNLGRQNWKAAIHWALKAAEANPNERYWRYLNAADFASRDRNAELALRYAAFVVDSDIATKAAFGKGFDWLRSDPRWQQLMQKVALRRELERQQRIEASLPFRYYQQQLQLQTTQYINSLATITSTQQLYDQIRHSQPTHRYAPAGRYQYAWVKLTDSLEFPYLIQLPRPFDARKRYPLVVVLHGAVTRQTSLPEVADSTHTFFGRLFMEQADQLGMIAVFPYSNRQFNWMMPEDGFQLVPELVRQVKHLYPIDDSRVYVTGHSNGATGAFSYLMKQPSLFAGFSGLNNRPQVRTGGTFLKNGRNRSFYNVATDDDYYFPLEGHRSITELAHKLGIDWRNQEVVGHRSHGYLITAKDNVSQQVYRQLFTHMLTQQRNPFQRQLYWECDDVRHGRCDWLAITALDTLASKADWQQGENVMVGGWRRVDNPTVVFDSTAQAFVFPRQSGAVQATYAQNRFEIQTSRVGAITLYLSPDMVDFTQSVKVVLNGKIVHDGRVRMDRSFLLAEYGREMDHQAVWPSRLQFMVR